MSVFIGAIWIVPLIPSPDMEEDDMQLGQFTALSGMNADLAALDTFRNFGSYNNINYWAEVSGDDLIIKQVTGLTGSTSNLVSTDVTASVGTGINTLYGTVCRIVYDYDNSKYYIVAAIQYLDNNTETFLFSTIYDLSAASSVSDGKRIATAASTGSMLDIYYYSTANVGVVFYNALTGGPTYRIAAYRVLIADGSYGAVDWVVAHQLADEQSFWAGIYLRTEATYLFVGEDNSNDIYLYSAVSGGGWTSVALTGITAPSTYNASVQLYWRQGTQEFLMDEDHFYYRTIGDTAWKSLSETGTTTNGVVWYYNSDGEYQISFIIWKDAVYRIFPQGGLGRLMSFTEDAYVGWGGGPDGITPWFADGTDTIYQFALVSTHTRPSLYDYKLDVGEPGVPSGIVQWGTSVEPKLGAWTEVVRDDCTISIVKETGGRKNMMELDDQSGANSCQTELNFGDRSLGSIEFTIRSTDVTKRFRFCYLYETSFAGGNDAFILYIDADEMRYNAGVKIMDVADNTNYDCRVDWDCATDLFSMWVDGVKVLTDAAFNTPQDNITLIEILTDNSDSGYQCYIDALWLSWVGGVAGSTTTIDPEYTDFVDVKSTLTDHTGKLLLKEDAERQLLWDVGDLAYFYNENDTLFFIGFMKDFTETESPNRKVEFEAIWVRDLNADITYSISTATATETILDAIAAANLIFCTYNHAAGTESLPVDYTEKSLKSIYTELMPLEIYRQYQKIVGLNYEIQWNAGTNLSAADYKLNVPGVIDWGTSVSPDLSDWTDNSSGDCTVSIVEAVDGHKNIMALDDQNAAAVASTLLPFTGIASGTIEFWIRSTDVTPLTYIYIADGSTADSCYFRIWEDDFQDGATNTDIVAVADNTWYHIKIVFNTTNWTPTINGTAYGPYAVQGTPTLFDRFIIATRSANFGYVSYLDALSGSMFGQGTYVADSNRYPYLFPSAKPFKVKPTRTPFKITEVYLTGDDSGGTPIDATARSTSVEYGDIWRDNHPTISDQTVLQTMADNIRDTMNVTRFEVKFKLAGVSMPAWGEQLYFNYPSLGYRFAELIPISLYYIDKVIYDPIAEECTITLSESLTFERETKTQANDPVPLDRQHTIQVPTDGVSAINNQDAIRSLAKKIRSREVLSVYLESNTRNLDERIWGFFEEESLGDTLETGTDITFTQGCHRILFVINTAADFSGTLTITGNTRDRTDSSVITVGNTEEITIDSLSTDNTSTDAEGNDIHAFLNVFMSDNWFEGAVTISTTTLTISDVDVYGVLYHQFDSYPNVELLSFDFTGACTNTAAWLYLYLYLIDCVNTNKKYNIENLVAHDITAAVSTADEGYRRRKVLNRVIDGEAGHGVWAEVFFGPAASTYWRDINIYLSALLEGDYR